MSFDLLVTILFILFFVLGPLLQRMGRGGQQQGRGRGTPPAPPGGPQERTRQEVERRRAEADASGRSDSPLSDRLEEARRRVMEAMGEEEGQQRRTEAPRGDGRGLGGREQGRLSGEERGGGRLADGRPDAPLDWQPDPSASRRDQSDLDWQKVVKPTDSFISETTPARPMRLEQTPSEVEAGRRSVRSERLDRRRQTAKLSLGRKLALDPDGVLHGLIWHEILSEPVSKRGTRRQTSRLRSR